MGFKQSFRALRHRNYRLFFVGQGLSLIGTWMQYVAMSWLVYQLTGSSATLGLTLFLGQIPSLFLSPFAGALVDRLDRARVFLVCQILAMLQAFALAALTFGGWVQVWHIMALCALLGIVLPFDMAARQAMTVQLVDSKKDFPNAIALSAAMFNASRLIGPALAGLLLAATSTAVCFVVNGISFVAILWALRLMKIPTLRESTVVPTLKAGVQEGFSYTKRSAPLRNLLLLIALTSLTSSVQSVLLPAFATEIMGGGAPMLGWLSSAIGVGSLFAALFIATRRTVAGLGIWAGAGAGILGAGLLGTAQMTMLPWVLMFFFLSGFGMVAQFASSNTIIQSLVDEDKRGRVMGLYSMAIVGMTPIGSYVFGWLGQHIGLTQTFAVCGLTACVASAAFLSWLPKLHGYIVSAEARQEVVS